MTLFICDPHTQEGEAGGCFVVESSLGSIGIPQAVATQVPDCQRNKQEMLGLGHLVPRGTGWATGLDVSWALGVGLHV